MLGLAPLVLGLLAVGGCGGSDEETTAPSSSRPDDFAFTFAHIARLPQHGPHKVLEVADQMRQTSCPSTVSVKRV